MHGMRRFPWIALTLSVACHHVEPPEGDGMDAGQDPSMGEDPLPVCGSNLFVGRVGPGDACADHDAWQAHPLGDIGMLAEFCEYTWSGGGAPDLSQLPGETEGVFGLVESCPRVLPQGDANAADAALRASLLDAFMSTVGKTRLAALLDEPLKQPTRLTFVDTIPATLLTAGGTPNDPHGRTLQRLTEGLLCDAPGPCPVEVHQSLGLPRITPELTDTERGGMTGSLIDLALGIDEAVRAWEQQGGQRPVLALAVGWEPLGAYGPELAGKSLDTLLAPGSAAADVQAVLAALTRAACHDAWIVAAVGNASGEPCTQTGAVGPGFLQDLAAPTVAQCDAAGFPHAPVLAGDVPFLLTAGHVDLDGGTPSNARVAAPASFNAQGTAPPPIGDDPILQGSSVAVVGLSAALTAVTAVCPELSRAEVLERLRPDDPSGINVCRAIRNVCGDHAAAAALDCPKDDDAAMAAVSTAISDKLAASTNTIQLGADYPDSKALADSACGTPTTVWPSVGELPPFEPPKPWTEPTPIEDYCKGCGVKIQANPPEINVGLTFPAVHSSQYPLLIEVKTSKGIEHYALDPAQIIAGINNIKILPKENWSDIQHIRLLVPTRDIGGRMYMRGEPLLRSYSAASADGGDEDGDPTTGDETDTGDTGWDPTGAGDSTTGEETDTDSLTISGDSTSTGSYVCEGPPPVCYDPEVSEAQKGVGVCQPGVPNCSENGWACEGGGVPSTDGCSTPEIDEDCDGEAQPADCMCVDGEAANCAFPAGVAWKAGKGICIETEQMCTEGQWEMCTLNLPDAHEDCDTPQVDENCDGVAECGTGVLKVVAGDLHTCALTDDGAVRCWGVNTQGVLGTGKGDTGEEVPPPMPIDLGPGKRVIDLEAGFRHTCALLDSGDVMCWGAGSGGRLGYGNQNNVGLNDVPAVAGTVDVGGKVKKLVTGLAHTCALRMDESVVCWGTGTMGRLGYGNLNDGNVDNDNIGDNETPASAGTLALPGGVVDLVAGSRHTCALFASGAVKCWGDASSGQLGYGKKENIGDNETLDNLLDVAVGGEVVELTANALHTCARLESGLIRCWGDNTQGKLGYEASKPLIGDDELPEVMDPIDLGELALEIAAGENFTCARLVGDAVKCWGLNDYGQLGQGDTNPRTSMLDTMEAVDLGDGVAAIDITVGWRHVCVSTQGDSGRCFGDGYSYQLGNGLSEVVGDEPGEVAEKSEVLFPW